jgi:hypothetical protein
MALLSTYATEKEIALARDRAMELEAAQYSRPANPHGPPQKNWPKPMRQVNKYLR